MHEYNLCAVLFYQMLLLKQCVKIIERNCDSFLSKTFGDFLDQIKGKWFGKIEDRTFRPCVEDLLHILGAPYISTGDHRNTDHPVYFLYKVNCLIVLFIRCGQIEDDQFVCPSVAVLLCKGDDIVRQQCPVIKPLYCLPAVDKDARSQSFIAHVYQFSFYQFLLIHIYQ